MKPETILQADWLDILFEDRNKSYGAYELRRDYGRRLGAALGLMLLFVALLLLWQFRVAKDGPATVLRMPSSTPDPTLTQVILEPPPVKLFQPLRRAASIANPPPVITPDELANNRMHTTEELSREVQIGRVDAPGDSGLSVPPPDPGPVGSAAAPAVREKAAPAVLEHADVAPEFPGGLQAFMRFMRRNLKSPEGELEPGEKVTVKARFVVGADGQVRDIEIVSPGGDWFNREVKRVLEKMPAWRPGRQAGKEVAVYFLLPVIFQAQNE